MGNVPQCMSTLHYLKENGILWFNSKMSNMELHLPNWFKQGFMSLTDIMFSIGEFLSQSQIFKIKKNYLDLRQISYLY